MTFLQVCSAFLGWVYLFCWSFCNLPQFLLIQKRRSVAGFSITFQVLNMIGFLWYFIYMLYGYIYQSNHPNVTKSIVWQDFAWCGATLIVVYGIAIQCVVYRHTITEKIHPFYQISIISIFAITFYNLLLVFLGLLPIFSTGSSPNGSADAYSFMHFLGYVKSYISFIKYTPQIFLNCKNQSTTGFSILQIILDVTGAVTSFGQSLLNAYINPHSDGTPDFDTVIGNIPKLLLSLESVFFCTILLIQHYWIYADNNYLIIQQEHSSFTSTNTTNNNNSHNNNFDNQNNQSQGATILHLTNNNLDDDDDLTEEDELNIEQLLDDDLDDAYSPTNADTKTFFKSPKPSINDNPENIGYGMIDGRKSNFED